jgi:hypothetical protein
MEAQESREIQPLLHEPVQASYSYESRATQESCPYHQGAFTQCRQLLISWNYQCGCRGNQQQDHGHQAKGGRLSQSQIFKTEIYFYCGGLNLYPQ